MKFSFIIDSKSIIRLVSLTILILSFTYKLGADYSFVI